MDKSVTYQIIRDEVVFLMQRQDNYNLAAYTICATMWTLVFTQDIAWLSIISLIILLPISLRVCQSRYSIEFLCTYLSVCLEDKTLSDWEYVKPQFKGKRSTIYQFSKFSFVFLSLISAIIFWVVNRGVSIWGSIGAGIVIMIIQIIFITIQIIISVKNMDTAKLKPQLQKEWERIKHKVEDDDLQICGKKILLCHIKKK